MTEVAVNYLVEKLLELGRENVELIAGVQDDVNDLVNDLQILKAFLKDASKINRDTAQGWKQSLKQIRNVVYKAEDCVDKFLVEAKQHQDVHPAAKWIDVPYWYKVKNVAKEIQSIRVKVKDLQVKYKHLLEATQLNSLSRTTPRTRELTLCDEDDVVGFEDEANTVIDRLIGGSKNLEAVPIVGMPGLGKSTLARKVSKDSRITFEFFSCIWVNVSRSYKKTEVLLSILKNFTKQLDNKSDEQIIEDIRTFLGKGGRCLIILDDVWHREVMDFIGKIFTKSDKGHRIMMTSREDTVASAFNEDIHKLNFLSHDNSWLLLKKKVFRKESCSSDLEDPGYKIATKCSGLPLAIVVIAGALLACKTKREWEHVNKNIGDHLINPNSDDSCLEFVKMSYDLLSYDAKACFLYCATFPRGFDIPAWKLIRLWIGEGFIPYDKNLTVEEKAEDYLNDLTKRNLVMVMNWTADGQIKTCRIHDMLYEFCKREASEEDLYHEITPAPGQSSIMMQDSDFCRRLCINSSILENFLSSFSKKPPMELVRSFLCFTLEQTGKSDDHLKTIHKVFPLIKVLDLEAVKFTFSKDFYRLLHLRYISFSGDFKALPEPFGRFWNLETLIINTTTPESTFEIKANIWSMLRLRHLHTNAPAKLPLPGPLTDKECCIQTLSTIAPQSCTKKIFSRARALRKLGIRGNVAALLTSSAGGLSDLAELKRLENLKLINDGQYYGKIIILPKLVFIFPKTLRKLTFSGTSLDWSEMSKLGQLESLEVLKLKEFAFKGEFWETDIGGFTSLLVLWIKRTDLKTWRASNRSFPCLKRLFLISCENLEEIPEGLADIPDLQEMKLDSTHKAAVKAARQIEKKKKEKKKQEELKHYAEENKPEHPFNFSFGFKLTVFPPDNDADPQPQPTH
ncbi:putative late blight resistance protein homolog R1A-3 [Lycium barbarum]|uniref:putative late blight resistance protein homolog R1A-3 n=1 Tax=Lycium barbarum TaxID=112863 RepID=UPI00293E5394|nr:putative late blight resistance protein homolog R1A-3 [Lycium barbarum]